MTCQVKIYKSFQNLQMYLAYFTFFTQKFYQANKNYVMSILQISLTISYILTENLCAS